MALDRSPLGQIGDEYMCFGSATSPAANAQITSTLASPPAGVYRIITTVAMAGGTPAAADDNNVYVQFNGGTKSVPSIGSLQIPLISSFRATLDGVNSIAANALGAATTGVRYIVSIRVLRVA